MASANSGNHFGAAPGMENGCHFHPADEISHPPSGEKSTAAIESRDGIQSLKGWPVSTSQTRTRVGWAVLVANRASQKLKLEQYLDLMRRVAGAAP